MIMNLGGHQEELIKLDWILEYVDLCFYLVYTYVVLAPFTSKLIRSLFE